MGSDGGYFLFFGDPEGGAAATGGHDVWVFNLEAGPLQAVDEVDHRATNVWETRVVDEESDSLVLENGVAVTLLIKGKRILKPGTTTAADAHAQTCGLGHSRLRGEKLANLQSTIVGKRDHASVSIASARVAATLESMSVSPDELKVRIESAIPGTRAAVSGDGHHFEAIVEGPAFAGLSRIDQHKLVYDVFGAELGDRIHALSLKITATEDR